ncbi:MBL fold metallo-hydrolase [Streptococcus cameli]
MNLHQSFNPVAGENTYYLENDHHLILVDPGSDWNAIQAVIDRINKPIAAILLTHTHYDHILSLDLVREKYNQPPVYVAESEADWLFDPEKNGLTRHDELENIILQPAEEIFQYDTPYSIEGFEFSVVQTPGHSIGGVSFIFHEEAFVITGDALFKGTIGRTDLPTGNFEQLIHSIQTQLMVLPTHYKVLPGHGPSTTIGYEKLFNSFLN